jgi:uncharacterized protein
MDWHAVGRFLRRHWFLEVFLVFVIGFIMFPHNLERMFVYYPVRQITEDPGHIGLSYQNLSIVSEDGVRLHGWFIPCEGANRTLLFFHGNAGNIGDRLFYIETFHKLKVHVFIIDYRGYGKSEGKPFEKGLYRDAWAAYNWWAHERQPGGEKLILFGESLGGAVAVNLASKVRPAGLILQSTLTCAKDIARENLLLRLLFPLANVQFDSSKLISQVVCPKLIIHGTHDEMIPFRFGKALYDRAAFPKTMYVVPEAGHNDLPWVAGEEYSVKLKQFLSDIN